MADALTISFHGWDSSNIARVRTALDLSLRNEQIREEYRNRGDEKGTDTIARIAKRECLSFDAVKLILWPR